MSGPNYCFLTCIPISQEAGKVVWCSHLLKNFPQFVVIHTVKGFGIVNKAEVDVFLELSCFFDDPTDIGNLAKSKEELKSLLMKVKEESEKVGLKLNFRKLRSWHPSHHFTGNRWGNNGNNDRLYFLGLQNHCGW